MEEMMSSTSKNLKIVEVVKIQDQIEEEIFLVITRMATVLNI